jgi:UDP-N-acetylmuramyl tripeptide synthase
MKRLETLGYCGPNRRSEKTLVELVLQPEPPELDGMANLLDTLLAELPVRLESLGLEPDWDAWCEIAELDTGPRQLLLMTGFIALTLQTAGGHVVDFNDAIVEVAPDGTPRWRALWEHDEVDVGDQAGDLALRIMAEPCQELAWDPVFTDPDEPVEVSLDDFLHQARFMASSPETLALLRVAREKGVPRMRLDREPYGAIQAEFRVEPNGMLMLGQCRHQALLDGFFCVQRSGPAFEIMRDRTAMWRFLAARGAPLPFADVEQLCSTQVEQAVEIAAGFGYPVRLWPQQRDPAAPEGHRIEDETALREHFQDPPGFGGYLVEPELPGQSLDILVIGSRYLFASVDGKPAQPDQSLAQFAVQVAQALNVGLLRLCLQVVPLEAGHEVKLTHLDPSPPICRMLATDPAQIDAVLGLFLDWLFPQGSDHSVPINAITGTNGKTTTSTMIAEIWMAHGRHVGLAQTEGIYFNGQESEHGDLAGFKGHCRVFENNETEVAVLETARGAVATVGFAWDRCDVAVCTNVTADHLGLQGIETVEQMAVLKRSVLERADQAVVLNADDAHCLAMIPHLARVRMGLVSMSQTPDQIRTVAGRDVACCVLETVDGEEWAVHYDGDQRQAVVRTAAIPATRGGKIRFNIFNAMAAATACLQQAIPVTTVCAALKAFRSLPGNVPGRMNHYHGLPFQLIIDHGHNADGVKAVMDYVSQLDVQGRRMVLVPGMFNRQAEALAELVEQLAGHFDHYFLSNYRTTKPEDWERVPGIFRQALLDLGIAEEQMTTVLDEVESIRTALDAGRPGDLLFLIVGHDVFPEMQPWLQEMGAVPD